MSGDIRSQAGLPTAVRHAGPVPAGRATVRGIADQSGKRTLAQPSGHLPECADNGPMSGDRRYERLKWTVLDEAVGENSGIVYYWAKRAFADLSDDELDPIVQQVLLELLDEGLVYFYWGTWDDGGDPNASERPSRAEVEADLKRGGDAPPIPRTVWFTSTEAGMTRRAEIAPETLLRYEEQQAWDAFVERHPEFLQKQEQWLEDTVRWSEEGGSGPRPEPPRLEYDDFPDDH
jgi:hypothetical protein